MRHKSAHGPVVSIVAAVVTVAVTAALGHSVVRAQAPPPATAVPEVVHGISAKTIEGHMSFLASDLMKGRDTATPEIRLAAEYLATRLIAAGAEPLGDTVDGHKTYFQSYPLVRISLPTEATELALKVGSGGEEVQPRLHDEYLIWPIAEVTPGTYEGAVVFAGYGLVDADAKYDDYAGLDVDGKFVIAYDGAPGGDIKLARTDAGFKREQAQQRGAVGLILVHPPGVAVSPYKETLAFSRMASRRPSLRFGERDHTRRIPTIFLEDATRDRLLGSPADNAEQRKPGPLADRSAHFVFPLKVEEISDRNVVGLFRGSDPERAKEVVVFSAHYDHVGTSPSGEIFNGSDDNASGTSALLEIAEAFGEAPRPARSVVFLWVSGEEHGLWGSQYYANHPALPEGDTIVADINLDMVSRNDTHQIGMTPSPKHADHSTLIPMAMETCKEEDLTPLFNADEFYARTDSFNFAAKGIPIIFFFCGVHEDYHRPTDDFVKADFEKAARVARAAFRLGWRVAQESEKPKKIAAEAAK